MKKISIVIPCYNEEENVKAISGAVVSLFERELSAYDYEIIFADNRSFDNTRRLVRELCSKNPRIKAIFNEQNFGQFNSPYYAMMQTSGDCTVLMAADFQDPPSLIPSFVKEWETGNYSVVCGIKTSSKENFLMYFFRDCYYKLINKMSDLRQIRQFTGFGLYDRRFIDLMKQLDDSTPFLRGIVAEYAHNRKEIPYEQPQRRAGKTHNNWYSLYDAAMLSFTSYTKVGLRLATFGGFFVSAVSFVIALCYLVMKLLYWERFVAGNVPILIGVFFLGGVQLFFTGLLGEYIMSINARVMHRPLVVEEERLNFEEPTCSTTGKRGEKAACGIESQGAQ